MVEISSLVISTLTGVMGVVIGAIISNYFNQRIARQAAKKDIIFKKKIEYFEKIVECIEKNTTLYSKSIKKLEKNLSKKEITDLLKNLKENRRRFEIMTSPLYMDIRPITYRIRQFVGIEKIIFSYFEKLRSQVYNRSDLLSVLKFKMIDLQKIGNILINTLRENLIDE